MNKQTLILHLSLIQGVGDGVIFKLAKILSTEKQPSRWYSFKEADFIRFGITELMAQKIVAGLANAALIDYEYGLIQKHGIQWITILDDEYPELLKNIHVPPAVLYWQGAPVWQNNDSLIAFVGARKGTGYGKRAVEKLIPDLVAQDWIVVSGGALGIDAMAHKATIQAGGKTVVVLGSGLLKPYPAFNKKLFEEVLYSGGAIVSCFPLNEEPATWTFPERNRIIAGLARGCVVVQAAEKSGALITASYALQEGRQVFAIPGQFDDELSVGCHKLLQQGAKLVQKTADIFEEFGIEESQDEAEQQSSIEQVVVASTQEGTVQDSILAYCAVARDLADISEKINIKQADLEQVLFELQLEGKVQQDFAGLWSTIGV